MNNALKNIRARVNGYPSYLLREDIKSLFSQRKTTSLGLIWYFFGAKKLHSIINNRYYDKSMGCYNIEGVKLPEEMFNYKGTHFHIDLFDMLGKTCFDYYRKPNVDISRFGCEGPYELKNVKIEMGDIVIDAGANMGVFSALASKRCCTENNEGAVYAFEPVSQNVELLEITAALNSGITIIPEGLSDFTGEIEIFLQQGTGEHTMLSELSKNKDAEKINIQTTTLDDFAHKNNLHKIDFIKADIEGAERLMLKGAKNVLKDFAPKLAICTYHFPDDPQVLRELILDANPDYEIEDWHMKMFAYVPR